MVQVIGPGTQRPTFGQKLGVGISRGIEAGLGAYEKHQERQAMKALGLPENLSPELAKVALAEQLKGQRKMQEFQMIQDWLSKRRGKPSGADLAGMPEEGGEPSVPSEAGGEYLSDEDIVALGMFNPQVAGLEARVKESDIARRTELEKAGRKEELAAYTPIQKTMEETRRNLPMARQAVEDIKTAAPKVGWRDWLADVLDFEPLRTAQGAKLKSAIKELFLSDLSRAGARPNMFLEKQLYDALPVVGRSAQANLIVAEGKELQVDLQEALLNAKDEIIAEDLDKYGYVKGRTLDSRAYKRLKPIAEQLQEKAVERIKKINEEYGDEKKHNIKQPAPSGFLRMKSPKGEIWDIPHKQAEAARKDGWTDVGFTGRMKIPGKTK